MSKFAFGIALAAAFIVLLPLGPDPTPARAQTAGHAYEVLPGLQPDYENPGTLQEAARRSFISDDVMMTCGWHIICRNPRGRLKDGVIESEYGNTRDG